MLTGERIRLRPIERTDIPIFVAWLADPDVTGNLGMWNLMSRADEERWFEHMLEKPLEMHPLAIEARKKKGWKLIGTIGFNEMDNHNRSAEIGIMIGEKEYWNKGYGTEAMEVMTAHGFDTIGLNRIFLHVYETNPAGIRCYEKAGYKMEGTLREAFWKKGRFINDHIMSVLQSEWKEKGRGR